MKKAKKNIKGKHEEEFEKLYQYGNEFKKAIPASTHKLMTESAEFRVQGRKVKRFLHLLRALES